MQSPELKRLIEAGTALTTWRPFPPDTALDEYRAALASYQRTLPPGSDDAIDAGCTCPVMDNGHGRGSQYGPGTYWTNGDCPLHATSFKDAMTQEGAD